MNTKTEVQYGIRYGDGEIDHVADTAREALDFIDSMRRGFSADSADPADYEPMTVMVREVVTTVVATEWADPTTPSPVASATDTTGADA